MKVPVPRKVLLVCTANQCRSPAAEYLLRQRLADAGLKVGVASAGVFAMSDIPAQPLTQKAMQELGLDLSEHRSQLATPELIDEADLVLGMSRRHVEELQHINPYAARKIFLFRPFCEGRLWQAADPNEEDDVEDPVGLPLEAHRACVGLIDELLADLVAGWREQTVRR
ncbi:MAG TPA: low molecular weight protein arginine phosphatase [Candidatus Xenobia bacterium]